ncbi:alpha-galactosidase [Paenibacillus sp. GCM10023252]|uniref:alpha-galactosidase n=1 Tax=Paenibacillus sp. GCM10023252 TaxID=3252649 RepID=UPI003620B622
MIRYQEDARSWVLETDLTAYVLGISERGHLLHAYYGSKLPYDADYPPAADGHGWGSFNSAEDRNPEEYMAWGGIRYAEPCLKATFADHVRDVVLQYDLFSIEGNQLTIVMRDKVYPLQVELLYQVLPGLNLIEREVRLANLGSSPITLEQALSGTLHLPREESYRLSYLTGKWAGETQLQQMNMPEGKFVMESRSGITSHHTNPWFALDAGGAADERQGVVYYGALAYSGNWKIATESRLGRTRVTAGIHDFDWAWELKGGTTFTVPKLVLGCSAEGFGGASRSLHDYQRQLVLPAPHRSELRKVLYNSWEATTFDVNEEDQGKLAEIAAELGVEQFIMDDGWFGARNTDKAGLGDWVVNPEKFPNGLQPLIDKVESLGMEFGIWVEPEMVNPDSDLYRAHPDWVYHYPTRERSMMRTQCVLNLARPDVREYLFNCLDKLLTDNRIRFVKWDMNRGFSEPGYPDASAEEHREIWTRHVQGLYEMVRQLKENHPEVIFQSCSGGGGRVDLGILQYFDQVWTSDNTDAYDRLSIQEGFSHVYSAKVMEAWVTAEEHWMNGRRLPLKYRFHSAMTGVLGIGEDLHKWSEAEREEAKGYIAQYKVIRPIVQHGRQYRLRSTRQGIVSSVMYVSEDGREAVVFGFLLGNRNGDELPLIRLDGLDAKALYREEQSRTMKSGSAWKTMGVTLPLRGDFDSCLLRLTRVEG